MSRLALLSTLGFGYLAVCASLLVAQSGSAALSGIVQDNQHAAIQNATVSVISETTQEAHKSTSNDRGGFTFSALAPGAYTVLVSHLGFESKQVDHLILNVGDVKSLPVQLDIGSVSQTITVSGASTPVLTTESSVSTVIDRQFVENTPLNGRSFQDLILLTPGVVTNSPQSASNTTTGQFSVNGQSANANYFTVDGVSANVEAGNSGGYATAATAGGIQAGTALGTTQSLISVDALQEFRVESSSYSAEYGRVPGGQFSLVTRSGTNTFHGTLYDYLRNSYFDANDWFNNYYGVKEPALRQNDFGGTLGGPIWIPKLYNGKDKSFFFVSYEGLRLEQPQEALPYYVPDLALRNAASGTLKNVLQAFPRPNGAELGDGLATYVSAYSNPSQIDSTSVRLDQAITSSEEAFFRVGHTPSFTQSNAAGEYGQVSTGTNTYTFGLTSSFSPTVTNEFRANYSSDYENQIGGPVKENDSAPVDLISAFGYPANESAYKLDLSLYFTTGSAGLYAYKGVSASHQYNFTDGLSWAVGQHTLKFGVDYRRTATKDLPENPIVFAFYDSQAAVVNNLTDFSGVYVYTPTYPVFQNTSLYAQDQWRVNQRLTLSYGLRYELNPPPTNSRGPLPYTLQEFHEGDPSTLALAPANTPLWQTTTLNLAPRLGFAFFANQTPRFETVLRAGGGLFYDTGTNEFNSLQGFQGPGFSGSYAWCPSGCNSSASVPFPLTADQRGLAQIAGSEPPYTHTTVAGIAPHLTLPYTWQYNFSVQQGLGASQALTLSYVAALGRQLIQTDEFYLAAQNPNFGNVLYTRNGLTSNYQSGQAVFQRRLRNGLQAYASYTFAKNLDDNRNNPYFPYQRSLSSLDVRHNFAMAISWEPKISTGNAFAGHLLNHWGLDGRFTVRSSFPVDLVGANVPDPSNGQTIHSGLNYTGRPVYLYSASYPGGRIINPAAFTAALSGQVGNVPFNSAQGFGANQFNLAIRRSFPIHERLQLEFRAESFNVLNHPVFGNVDGLTSDPTFGRATASLANSLGGLSAQYQDGGARSLQFSLKLKF